MRRFNKLVLVALGTLAMGLQSAHADEVLNAFQRSDGKYGYVNADHCWAIEPRFNHAWSFSEGLAAVEIGGKYGFIDKTGRFVINPQFDFAGEFDDGLAEVKIGGKWSRVDKTGRWLLDPTCSVSR
jgi:hypothetical protein